MTRYRGVLLLALYIIIIPVIHANYPLHIDILVDSSDHERIANSTEYLLAVYGPMYNAAGIFPVSYNVVFDNEIPGITSFKKKATNSSFYMDLRDKPSSVLCTLSKALDVSYVRTSVELTNGCQPIRIRPTVTQYIETAQQIFEYDGRLYTDVVLLTEYKHDIDLNIFTRGNDTSISLKKFTLDGNAMSPTLQTFITDGNTHLFIFLASSTVIESIMSQITQLTIIRVDHWIIIPTTSMECPSPNTTFFFVCLHHDQEEFNLTGINQSVLDEALLSRILKYILAAAGTFNSSQYSKSLTGKQKFALHAKNYLLNSDIPDLKMVVEKVEIEQTIKGNQYGNWTSSKGLILKDQPFDPIPASLMTVVVIHEPPFVYKFTNESGVFFRGYSIDVLDKLAKEMGFDYITREVPDGQYGIALPNGSWTGIIGTVTRGMADLGVGPISITAERELVIDFTIPYYDYAGLQILMNHDIISKSMFGFVESFNGLVWVTWVGFLFVTSTLLFLFNLFTFKVFAKTEDKDKMFSISDALWFVISSITLQGPDRHPASFSSRILVVGFWFFCQIMLATYTANMAAFMTTKRLSFDIESLTDLYEQSTISYSALAGSVSETYFKRMTAIENKFFDVWRNMSYSNTEAEDLTVWDYPLNDLYTRLFIEINRTGFLTTSAEGIRRVLEGRFAFIHETPLIKYEQTRQCNLLAVGEVFSSKPYAFVLPENSPLKKEFNTKILGLQSSTFLNDMKEKWWPDTLKCETEDDSTTGMPVENLLGVIIMTSVGCGIGLVILALEIYVYRRRQKTGKAKIVNKTEEEKKDVFHLKTKSEDIPDAGEKKGKMNGGIMTILNDL